LDETQLRLDGNAAAGLFSEIFVQELTGARSACASCGAVGDIGVQHLYMYPLSPGAVLRCHRCESVLLVIVRTADGYRLGINGLAWLEMQAPAGSSP
jgi:hypothetical protein